MAGGTLAAMTPEQVSELIAAGEMLDVAFKGEGKTGPERTRIWLTPSSASLTDPAASPRDMRRALSLWARSLTL